MRALLILVALAACQSEKPADSKPVPADRSTTLTGDALETFCREQERVPGWTCDDYANCVTVAGHTTECHARP